MSEERRQSKGALSDFEKGTLGYEMERLENELVKLAETGNPLVRALARRRLRKMDALRRHTAAKRDAAIARYFTEEGH